MYFPLLAKEARSGAPGRPGILFPTKSEYDPACETKIVLMAMAVSRRIYQLIIKLAGSHGEASSQFQIQAASQCQSEAVA